jgi:hypothetical protein
MCPCLRNCSQKSGPETLLHSSSSRTSFTI